MSNQVDDLEAALLIVQSSIRELKWALTRKAYAAVTLQLLSIIAVAAAVEAVHPIHSFFGTTGAGLAIYISIVVTHLIVSCLLAIFQAKPPLNLVLFGIFTLCFGLVFGLATSFTSDPVILEAATAAALVVVSLIAYTYWAAKRGPDFGFLLPFLITVVITVGLYTIFQMYFPMRKFSNMICSGLAVLVFCASIIYSTK